MAFLDNSGDIILDAVLTDTGRMRMARGDGSFRIAKFALGDDEIDYELYDKNNASGSAFYDLNILRTPILEAFTNNASSMNSKLLTIPRTNLLFLPIIKLNEANAATTGRNQSAAQAKGSFIVAANMDTAEEVQVGIQGMMLGQAAGDENQTHVQCDQGLDTSEISPIQPLDAELTETQYSVEIDNRFGRIVNLAGQAAPGPAFIDDDNIANYYITTANPTLVKLINDPVPVGEGTTSTIRGPRGTFIKFRIASSVDIASGNFLFTKFGNTGQSFTKADGVGVAAVSTLDTTVRVTGLTTGYRIDIPVRFIRKE
tara:strand:- start:643 stop:1584 length:942 start_codon:yes stop_codon:yes gene_type:complete